VHLCTGVFPFGNWKAGNEMEYVVPSFSKLNLTLRAISRQDDGFHQLISLFLRLPPTELLTINELSHHNVKDIVETVNIQIEGENILSKVLAHGRDENKDLLPLQVRIFKSIPPGTGLGAGSGNAAALIGFLRTRYQLDLPVEAVKNIGSDVHFLLNTKGISLVAGLGERIENLSGRLEKRICLFIPPWRSVTSVAYERLDSHYGIKGYPLGEVEAREEALAVFGGLLKGEHLGLLPNDFLPVLLNEHPEYERLFNICKDRGAQAWGITGSGSAAFGIFDPLQETGPLEGKGLERMDKIFITGVMIDERRQN